MQHPLKDAAETRRASVLSSEYNLAADVPLSYMVACIIFKKVAAMPSVTSMSPVTHPSLPGVRIFPTDGQLRAGSPQTVLVEIEPQGSIPLHSHKVDAVMMIVGGTGWVCSTDATDGHPVSPGYRVFYEAEKPHGFRAGEKGLSFISINGGIVDEQAELWDFDTPQT